MNDSEVALARYNEDSTLDDSFGDHGMVLAGFPSDDAGRAVALTKEGKIVVAGFRENVDADFAIWRFHPDGSADLSFNVLGFSTADFGFGDDYGQAVR